MADTPTSGVSSQHGAAPARGQRNRVRQHRSRPTRISAAWVAVIAAAVVLALLLVFILQNTRSVKISYFTANGTLPLGVALLLAAIGGVLLAGAVGSFRIWQLRHSHKLAGQGKALSATSRLGGQSVTQVGKDPQQR